MFVLSGRGTFVTDMPAAFPKKLGAESRKMKRLLSSCRTTVSSLFLGPLVQKKRRLRVSFVRPQAPGVVVLARSSLSQR